MNIFGRDTKTFFGKNPAQKHSVALIIDDDKVFTDLFKTIVEKLGFECHVLNSAQEAYKMLDSNYYEVVFCDVMMPDFDLHTFLGYMEKRFPAIKFVIVSGVGIDELKERYLSLPNVKQVICKPISPGEVKEVLSV